MKGSNVVRIEDGKVGHDVLDGAGDGNIWNAGVDVNIPRDVLYSIVTHASIVLGSPCRENLNPGPVSAFQSNFLLFFIFIWDIQRGGALRTAWASKLPVSIKRMRLKYVMMKIASVIRKLGTNCKVG